jgi:hypothetical protein
VRLTARTLAKVSARLDDWPAGAFSTNGYALAFQVSQQFDVVEWIR